MKEFLTLTGQDALTLGSAANRQPEVFSETHWRTVNALPEASRALTNDPTTVRLQAPTRVLVEDILKVSIQPGADVGAAIQTARLNTLKPLSDLQLKALEIIQRECNA